MGRALFLWNNDIIATFTSDHRTKILPIIYPALQKNYSKHWNSTVSSLTLNIIRIFKEMDKELYEEVAKNYKNGRQSPTIKNKKEKINGKQYNKCPIKIHQFNYLLILLAFIIIINLLFFFFFNIIILNI